jgi:hypothetical protein
VDMEHLLSRDNAADRRAGFGDGSSLMYADPKFQPLPLEAVTLLQEGHVIAAIKVVRQAEGLGLKEAKRRVDAYLSREPLLRAQLELKQRSARRKFFFWFLVIDLLILAGAIYWFYYRVPV